MPHIPDSHADHDPLAIAAYAAGDATGADLELASGLVARCAACAALHHDLRAIAAAVSVLPAPARPRDFRLAPEQAASLRPSGWRRLLAPLAGPRFAFAGPLGTGLATLGVAGLLVAGSLGAPVASLAPADGGGVAAVPTDEVTTMVEMAPESAGLLEGAAQASMAPGEAPVPEGSADTTGPAAGSGASSPDPMAYGGDAGASPEVSRSAMGQAAATEAPAAEDAAIADAAPPPVLLPGLAGLMLVAGLILAGARLLARRLA